MKNKGFTLIELLAVIVILAIIALIATPIILNIIDDTKQSSKERSLELYLDAVEQSLTRYNLEKPLVDLSDSICNIVDEDGEYYDKNGELVAVKVGDLACKNDGTNRPIYIKIETDGQTPVNGTITFDEGNLVSYRNVKIQDVYLTKVEGKMYLTKEYRPLCKKIAGAEDVVVEGDKYICEVDPNKEAYTFYVLNVPQSKSAKYLYLIMDSNITRNGDAVKESTLEEEYGSVEWISKVDYISSEGTEIEYGQTGNNKKGPITAMNYLKEATSKWYNSKKQTIKTFKDEVGNIYNMISIESYARLPYYEELSNYASDGSNAYLYNYLYGQSGYQTNATDAWGYWTLTSSSSNSSKAWVLYNQGSVFEHEITTSTNEIGVRPVIAVLKSEVPKNVE